MRNLRRGVVLRGMSFDAARNFAQRVIGHFRVQNPSLLKRGPVQNLSCENEFYLHDNKKSFS